MQAEWLDYIPYVMGLIVLLVGLWGQGWKRRALAAEKAMNAGDKLSYELTTEIDRRNKAAQAAANRTVMETLYEELGPGRLDR